MGRPDTFLKSPSKRRAVAAATNLCAWEPVQMYSSWVRPARGTHRSTEQPNGLQVALSACCLTGFVDAEVVQRAA